MLMLSKKLESLVKYLVAAILLVVPLYPKFPFVRVPGTFVSIRIEDFIIALSAIVILPLYFGKLRKVYKDKMNIAILLYIVVGFVSLISAIFVTQTVTPHIGILHWLRRIEYFVPFFLGLLALKNANNLEFYLKLLMISIVIMFIYGLGQKYLQWPIIITQNQEYSKGVALRYVEGGHINSTFAGHYDLSSFLVMLLPVFACLSAHYYGKTKCSVTTLCLSLVMFCGTWLLAFSGSRVSSFSYLLALISSLIFVKKFKAIPLFLTFTLLIYSTSPSLQSRYMRIISVFAERFQTTSMFIRDEYIIGQNIIYASEEVAEILPRREVPTPTPTPPPVFEDRSTNIRLNVEWPRALRAFLKNPLLGTGFSSITLATDNDYLRILGEVGLLGMCAFSLIFLRIANLFIRGFPFIKNFQGIQLAFVGGIAGSFLGIFINAVFIDLFEASKFATIFWLMMGLVVVIIRHEKLNIE